MNVSRGDERSRGTVLFRIQLVRDIESRENSAVYHRQRHSRRRDARARARERVLHIYWVHGRLLKLANTPPRGKWSVLNLNKNTGSRVHKPSL